jgi:hypothetical protein
MVWVDGYGYGGVGLKRLLRKDFPSSRIQSIRFQSYYPKPNPDSPLTRVLLSRTLGYTQYSCFSLPVTVVPWQQACFPPSTKQLKGRPPTKWVRARGVRGPRAHEWYRVEVAGEQIPEVTQVRARRFSASKEAGIMQINARVHGGLYIARHGAGEDI